MTYDDFYFSPNYRRKKKPKSEVPLPSEETKKEIQEMMNIFA